jgi:hypothetical protein
MKRRIEFCFLCKERMKVLLLLFFTIFIQQFPFETAFLSLISSSGISCGKVTVGFDLLRRKMLLPVVPPNKGAEGKGRSVKVNLGRVRLELDLRKVGWKDCKTPEDLIKKLQHCRKNKIGDDHFFDEIRKGTKLEVKNIDSPPPDLDIGNDVSDEAKEMFARIPPEAFKHLNKMNPKVAFSMLYNSKAVQLMQDPKLRELYLETVKGGPEAFLSRAFGDPGLFSASPKPLSLRFLFCFLSFIRNETENGRIKLNSWTENGGSSERGT